MKFGYVKSLAAAGGISFAILPFVARAQLVDLGEATGYALNNAGQVALSTGIYSNGSVTVLPALPGQTEPATPLAINATGQAAGSAVTQVIVQFGGGNTKLGNVPVAYINGTLTDVALPSATGPAYVEPGIATGINASGEVVGYFSDFLPNSTGIDPAATVGFVYANGTLTAMPFGNYDPNYIIPVNNPFGINDSGQVTGTFATAGPQCIPELGCNEFDAYIYDSKTGALTDIGWGTGYAINNTGQVTGTLDEVSFNSGGSAPTITGSYAFLYTKGTTINLGPGTGYAINATGQVVGTTGQHAFFYNGATNDLNLLISATDPLKPYVTLTSAVGINDNLMILANGVDSRTGQSHAYLYQASFIQLAPATLDFAMLAVGGTSLAQSVTITNASTAAIQIGTAYVSGDFSLRADSCGASLAPSDQCRLSVVFTPKVAGAVSGVLTIPVGGADYQVPLSGSAPITTTISASSGTATVGQPLTLTWAISPGATCTAASSSTNTAWTASNPPFAGTKSASGQQTLTETVNGTVTYTLNCAAPGIASVNVSASVVWNWPPVTISISASPITITAGQSTTIAWTASNATSCTASGGGPADMWPGTKATSGTQTVTESFALETSSVVLTFVINCSSTVTGLSGQSSLNVTENRATGGSTGAVSATITASPTIITVGQSTTLTWTSYNSTSCTATGGGAGDSWGGTKATSGSQVVTETATLDTSSVVLTFGITCNSSSSGGSGKASVNVTENQAAATSGGGATPASSSSSGGGGGLNWLSLTGLAGIFALRRMQLEWPGRKRFQRVGLAIRERAESSEVQLGAEAMGAQMIGGKRLAAVLGLLTLAACGGGGGGGGASTDTGGSGTSGQTSSPTWTAKGGVAQKGPLIKGSTVTAQELDSSLSPTGAQYTYQTTSDLGTFSPTSTFTSEYIGLLANGYYFDEVVNAVSSGPVTLNAYSDLAVDSLLNVNLLTTLEYQRIQNLVTKSSMTFAAARTQAETEVLAALNIPAGNYGSFDSLDLSGRSDGDHILAAISALFVYGNSAGPLSQLIANFQSDIGSNGFITNAATAATLVAAAKQLDPGAVATNLTQFYASDGLTFTAANISDWIAQSGDGVVGRFVFVVSDATPSTALPFPSYVVSQFAGLQVAVTAGQLLVNGTPVSGTVSFSTGDSVALLPSVGDFPNGVLTCYLVTGKTNLARVSFVSGLASIAITPDLPSVPLGATQQFKATGTFSDTSTADLTNSVAWTSGTPAVATVNASSGLANALMVGSTMITATSGSVSASTTLTITPAALVSIAIMPNPVSLGAGKSQQLTATGTYSDGTTQDVTTVAKWSSDTPSVATVGPSTGLAVAVSAGSATISATIGSISASATFSVPALQSIAITPNPITIGAGKSQQLTATGTYSDGSTQDVSAAANWTSDTPSVATVGSSTGLVTGVSPGSATISATIGSIVGTALLSVPALASIQITPNALTIGVGMNLQLSATGIYTDGSRQDLTGVVDWASSTPTVATIGSTTGLATGVSAGTTTVSATRGSIVGNTLLAVTSGVYSGVWQLTGSMATPRASHTATLLTNGSVLVAGGDYWVGTTYEGAVASAEIYNPAAGTWTATGSMAATRTSYTATLLPNGTVLVAGGESTFYRSSAMGSDSLASAEIYDPVAGTWTPTGSMAYARLNHTATLLPNGTVLVAGGGGAPWLASAEIYDPVAGTWTTTGSMTYPRADHTATLLANGTVLVAGGQYDDSNDNDLLPSVAEIYDPGTGVWTVTGTMMTGRVGHTATPLPNGKVLVAGGYGALGGSAQSGYLSSAEIYDPTAGTWTSAASMITARGDHTATLLSSGKVLVAGGCGCVAPVSNAEVYDPVLGTWITTSSMSTDRWGHTATLLLDGTVLVAGGTPNNGIFLSSAEIYH